MLHFSRSPLLRLHCRLAQNDVSNGLTQTEGHICSTGRNERSELRPGFKHGNDFMLGSIKLNLVDQVGSAPF